MSKRYFLSKKSETSSPNKKNHPRGGIFFKYNFDDNQSEVIRRDDVEFLAGK